MSETKMHHKPDRKTTRWSSWLIFVIVVALVVGGFAYFRLHGQCKKLGTLLNGTTGDLAVTAPCDGDTVGSTFAIRGTAPASSSHETVSILIDNQWTYLPPSYRGPNNSLHVASLEPGKKFSLPIDLTGARAAYSLDASSGHEKTVYHAISPGKHTFTVSVTYTGGATAYIQPGPSAKLTLTVR